MGFLDFLKKPKTTSLESELRKRAIAKAKLEEARSAKPAPAKPMKSFFDVSDFGQGLGKQAFGVFAPSSPITGRAIKKKVYHKQRYVIVGEKAVPLASSAKQKRQKTKRPIALIPQSKDFGDGISPSKDFF